MALSLPVQKRTVCRREMEPIMDRFVVEKPRPQAAQEHGGREQTSAEHKKKAEEQGRDRQAESKADEEVLNLHRFRMMDEVEFLTEFPERSAR